MIVRLKCVMMDGTAPMSGSPLVPLVQHLDGASVDLPAIPAGVDVIFEFAFVGQNNAPFDMTGYTGKITCRHSRVSAVPVFANAITMSGTSGTSFATHDDTENQYPRTCVYDVKVYDADAAESQPIPESHLRILSAISDPDDDVTVAGPAMVLVGLPSQNETGITKGIRFTSLDPLAFELAAITGGGAALSGIAGNFGSLPDPTSTTSEIWATSDDGKLYYSDGSAWTAATGTPVDATVQLQEYTDGTRPSPVENRGLVIFNTTASALQVSNGSSWVAYASASQTEVGSGAIPAGALVKLAAGGLLALWLYTDNPNLIVGWAVTACAGASQPFSVDYRSGALAVLLSDGTGTIDDNAPVIASPSHDGRVRQGAATDPGYLGRSRYVAVDATLDATVYVQ